MRSPQGQIWVITGWREQGKSTLVQKLAGFAQAQGWQVAGLTCPAVFSGGQKTAIDALDLATGACKRLAWRRELGSAAGVATSHWSFDSDVLEWGNTVLQAAVPCDLLVVDELGPLEFERGQGWTAGLSAVDGRNYHVALVVIRPELVDVAKNRWPDAQVVPVDRTGAADLLAVELAQKIGLLGKN